jgi:hypothetical protein
MRTLLFWLLPLYNLFTAIGLVRQLAFHDANSPTSAPTPPHRLAVYAAWVLGAAAVANIPVVRDPRFMAMPYVLFALNLLAGWRLVERPQQHRRRTRDTEATVGR